jgi:hypothetical protein
VNETEPKRKRKLKGGPRGRPRVYPFPQMEVGSTCVYPYDGPDEAKIYTRVRVSVLRWARLHGGKFTTEKTHDGVLIKRIE